MMQILAEEIQPDEGSIKWGVSTSRSYFPKDNSEYFNGCELNILQWLSQYSKDITETYLRGFLGRMLFSGDDVYKPVQVLSGGEKVQMCIRDRCSRQLDQLSNECCKSTVGKSGSLR